ncbi:hypothetical protein D3C87_125950 [compost metagenome]
MYKTSTVPTIFSIFISLAAFVGCADHRSTPPPTVGQPKPQAQAEQKKKVDSCDTLKNHFNESNAKFKENEQNITIERHYQRVIRKDCSGKVTSDSIETVKAPHYDIALKAPSKKNFKSVFIFNQNSCAHKLTTMPVSNIPLIGLLYAVTGDGKSKIEIKGDLADALLTFKLEKGQNQIFVQYFYDCSPESVEGNTHASVGTADCKNSLDSTIVEYPINVNYIIKNLEGSKEVSPSPASCKPSQP